MEEEGHTNEQGERVAENRESNTVTNTGKPRTEDEMMMEIYQNTQVSLTDSETIALTEDSQDMPTEEQSVDNKKRKIPLKENQKITEVRMQAPKKYRIGEH